jgi:hypothetical protein
MEMMRDGFELMRRVASRTELDKFIKMRLTILRKTPELGHAGERAGLIFLAYPGHPAFKSRTYASSKAKSLYHPI